MFVMTVTKSLCAAYIMHLWLYVFGSIIMFIRVMEN